jgi:GT2 family glycosyltransferase
MAYRRSVFDDIGPFDPALDVGTVTNGGGDLEMFFRVLKGGHTLVYEPRAVVRHRHRRDYDRLRSQLTHNGTGLFSYCTRCIWHYPKEWRSLLMLSFWWIVSWNLRRVWMSFKHPTRFPRDLVLAELWGSFVGLTRYFKARRIANEIASSCGPTADEQPTTVPAKTTQVSPQGGIAIRTVELSESLSPLEDVAAYSTVRLFAKWCDCPKGRIDLPTNGQSIGVERLIEVLVERLQLDLLEPDSSLRVDLRQTRALSTLTQQWLPSHPENEMTEAGMAIASLPANIPVSVVVATYDRPEDLRQCLRCLIAQVSPRTVELVVVDNHPASGLTPPVVAEFPEVVQVQEARAGLAYARNAGFAACQGQIAVATDDDVLLPSDWLEKLVAPFARADVGIVTGNVLPRELETLSQICFETYGGLGRGFEPKTFDGEWFESSPRRALPTWELGATANAAFRTSLFNHPQVGLMEESLGPGMPSGVGEDTYLFYKVLKAGFTAVYEPAAYVWHNHRRDMKSLRKQIYGYSKGHVAYNLTTWLQDGDWRGLVRVLMELPAIHLLRAVARVRGKSDYPLSLLILEVWGNLAAPWSLWRSRQRVKREGRSQPYLPPHQRGTEQQEFSSELVTEVDSGSEPSPFLPPLTETPAH